MAAEIYSAPFLVSQLITLSSSELIVQLVLKQRYEKHLPLSREFKARSVQLLLLLLLSFSFPMFVHLPCLLILSVFAVTMRLFVLKCYKSTHINASKKLWYAKHGSSQVRGGGTVAFSVSQAEQISMQHNMHFFRASDSSISVDNSFSAFTPPSATSKRYQHSPYRGSYSQKNPQSLHTLKKDSLFPHMNFPNRLYQSSILHRVPLTPLQYSLPAQDTVRLFRPSPQPFEKEKLLPPGIVNTGNICFLSSSIQCLASVDEFFAVISTVCNNDQYSSLIVTLHDVLKQTRSWQLSWIDPSPLLESVSVLNSDLVAAKKQHRSQSQQDAGEFLLWLLDNLHMAYKESTHHNQEIKDGLANNNIESYQLAKRDLMDKIKDIDSNQISVCYDLFCEISAIDKKILNIQDMSSIYQLFCGQVLEARECQQCRRMSVNIEYHTVLPLPVPNSNVVSSLVDCFSLFGEVENLFSEKNLLLCSFCSQNTSGYESAIFTPGKRLTLFSILPKKLVIQLTRFSYNNIRKVASKNQSPVTFSVTDLDLSQFAMDNKLSLPSSDSKQYLYSLNGFCVHTGAQSTSHGHYVAYTKVKDGNWYQFNDDHVTHIQDISVEIKSPFVSQNTYLLFYSQK